MSYNTSDAATRLQQVREAIDAVLTGAQAYGIGSRNLTRASLSDLRKMEKDLMEEVANQSATGGSMVSLGRLVRP